MSRLSNEISGCDLSLEGDLILLFFDCSKNGTLIEIHKYLSEKEIDKLKRYLTAKQILEAKNEKLRIPVGVGRGGMESILQIKDELLEDLEKRANLKKISNKFGL